MIKDPFQRLNLDREILSVSQLNGRARVLLEDVFAQVWVEGEISNLAKPASGHLYFTLKDSQAQVRCALFRQNAAKVRQALRDGLAVKVRGKVSLFEGRGDYQLIVDSVEPAGDGALRLAFEALKDKLSAEGLFSAERKQTLPAHPKRIGIISSPTGAVIRDIISVFRRRAPQVQLTLIPTPVQGRDAGVQIIHALQLADRHGFDALILARGGGSLEDLWCFNEEPVARAVAACKTPIISAVGHETDVSICDFVADVRAPTPSAAAELLAPDMGDLQLRLSSLQRRLVLRMQDRLARERLRLDGLRARLRHPGERLRCEGQLFRLALGGKERFQVGIAYHSQPKLIGAYDPRRNLLIIRRISKITDNGLYFDIADNDQPRGAFSAADSYSIFNGGEMGFFELETIAPLHCDAAGRGTHSTLCTETLICKGAPDRLGHCLEDCFGVPATFIGGLQA